MFQHNHNVNNSRFMKYVKGLDFVCCENTDIYRLFSVDPNLHVFVCQNFPYERLWILMRSCRRSNLVFIDSVRRVLHRRSFCGQVAFQHLQTLQYIDPLTLQYGYGGLGSDPGDGRVLVMVVASRVVAGPALVHSGVLQREARDGQHADAVGAVRRVDGHPPLASAVPQQLEGIRSVDIGVPPLDLRHRIPHHVTVELEGVSGEFGL